MKLGLVFPASVVFVIPFVAGCAAKPPAFPSRDETRGDLYAVEWGVHQLDHKCATLATEDIADGKVTRAYDLASECKAAIDDVRAPMVAALDELEKWGDTSGASVACDAQAALEPYRRLKAAVESRGVALEEADDGEKRALWLASRCK